MIREPENGFLGLTAANEFLNDTKIRYRVTDLGEHSVVCEAESVIAANKACELGEIPYDSENNRFYLLEWEYNGVKCKNHYISGAAPYDFERYTAWLREAGLI